MAQGNAIEPIYEEGGEEQLLHTEYNFMGRSKDAKTPEILWHNCVKVLPSEFAALGIVVKKKPDPEERMEIQQGVTVFRINGWTKPPIQIEVGDKIGGIMYIAGTCTVISVEYSDHPGHFGSKRYVQGKPRIVPVFDNDGVKISEKVENTYELKFVNDNKADAVNSRFLVLAVGEPFVKAPPVEKEVKPKTKTEQKKESRFIDPGDLPPDND